MKFQNSSNFFYIFIILVKFVFIVSALGHIILSHISTEQSKNIDSKLVYWKERTEFIFIISMAILLIYEFNPYQTKTHIDDEATLLFFLFGFILIITAKWSLFFKEADWYKQIVHKFT